jgi:hypothetical protein
MNTRVTVALAILLALGSARPTGAQPTPPPGSHESNCEQDIAAIAPQARGGYAAVATVIQVDHQHGLLHLDTDRGRLLTFATPEDIADLREGDQLVVCIASAEPAENPPQDGAPLS